MNFKLPNFLIEVDAPISRICLGNGIVDFHSAVQYVFRKGVAFCKFVVRKRNSTQPDWEIQSRFASVVFKKLEKRKWCKIFF